MAMVESASAYRHGIDLEDLVKNATWRELLMDLVESNRLDPWDMDLVKIVDTYISVVKAMRVLDLHIPANIMLAASILLRMKSDTIGLFEEPEIAEEPALTGERVTPEIPNLVPRIRMQPRRKITLNELMQALDEAMKITEKREFIERERFEPLTNIVISKEDIDDKIKAAMGLVKKSVDREGVTTLTRIAKGFATMESMLLDLFVPLLFLTNMNKIALTQEEFFNEIFIRVGSDKNG